MRKSLLGLLAVSIGISALAGCATPQLSPAASQTVAGELLIGCVRGAVPGPCRDYFNLYQTERLLRLEQFLADNNPRIRFIPAPLPPGCDDPRGLTCPTGFDTVFADARARILGDATPQPNGPVLPFSAYPAAAQLEDTLRLREGLEQQIHVLDGEIAVLQAAVEKGGQ